MQNACTLNFSNNEMFFLLFLEEQEHFFCLFENVWKAPKHGYVISKISIYTLIELFWLRTALRTVAQCKISIKSIFHTNGLLVVIEITMLSCMMAWILYMRLVPIATFHPTTGTLPILIHTHWHTEQQFSFTSERLKKPSMWIDGICCYWSGKHWPLHTQRFGMAN